MDAVGEARETEQRCAQSPEKGFCVLGTGAKWITHKNIPRTDAIGEAGETEQAAQSPCRRSWRDGAMLRRDLAVPDRAKGSYVTVIQKRFCVLGVGGK